MPFPPWIARHTHKPLTHLPSAPPGGRILALTATGLPLVFLICLVLAACGQPVYRLDGSAPPEVRAVSLLDASAVDLLDSTRAACKDALANLDRDHSTAADSLERGLARSGDALRKAQVTHSSAVAAYEDAFSGLSRFRSFGGNSIFSDRDVDVATTVLLEEVADRSYNGKAFSLETEAEIRRFVRSRLVPAERSKRRSRNAVIAAKRSRTVSGRARSQLDASYTGARSERLGVSNRSIREGLAGLEVAKAAVDSTGRFLFSEVPAGRYLIYTSDVLPEGWLVPVRLSGHRRQDLIEKLRRPVQITVAPDVPDRTEG